MSKYIKEIVIGFVLVLLVFMAYIGLNIIPVIIGLAMVGSLYAVVQMRGGITVGASQEKKRKKAGPAKLTFEEIGGQDSAKQELREALDFMVRHEEIQKFGIRPLKGILLTGPPGTGKTLMAKAAAHYTKSVFVAASGSEFVEMYVGVGAGRIRDLFKEARTRAAQEKKENAIIFIDEIDVIGGKREGGQQREYDQTLNQLLTEMDGIYNSDTPRILLIAATNRKEMLDSALLRPGRFDRHIQVDLPDKKGRKHILELHAKNKPLHANVSLDKVADETYGFSGAQLESVMNEGAIYAMRENLSVIEQRHLSMGVDKVMLGEKNDRQSTYEEKRRVAVHELGHAILAEIVAPGSVNQVALSPRGQALGYVRHNPQEEQYLYTKSYLEGRIMVALAGAAAEEIYYGGRSTGSSNDFEQALKLVHTMMTSGLTSLGIVNMDMVTKEVLMKENSSILDELAARTKAALIEHAAVFDKSLDILMSEERLSGDEFRCQFRDSALLPA
ncbi:AAA family ATPase [Paenibacillus sp. J22TS3]|uniref:AAA family ATPase n=1 Tax=Paenibacillus sp. J22TS3 TaxID=2807192 RepID=UPI001AFD58B2|nr:AAA family ATPase [Paenibacillus sp. J22TS3]GIP20060.1 microtubule-severing ATPase [Paenibacillus sp. J22TS3]